MMSGMTFYIHVDDSVYYSEEYDYYLYDNNAVSVINEIERWLA
jgi:hypothetical protein